LFRHRYIQIKWTGSVKICRPIGDHRIFSQWYRCTSIGRVILRVIIHYEYAWFSLYLHIHWLATRFLVFLCTLLCTLLLIHFSSGRSDKSIADFLKQITFFYLSCMRIEYAAFFVGWTYVLLYQLAGATVMVSWSQYVVHFFEIVLNYNASREIVQSPLMWSETNEKFHTTGQIINLPAIAIVLAISFILFLGIRETSITNLVLVVFKLTGLLIFIFAGCIYIKLDNYHPFFPKNQGKL
jgi:amino acid transporter